MNHNPEERSQPTDGAEAVSKRRSNTLGATAGLAGVVGVLVFFAFTRGIGLFVAIGAMLLGFVARSQARSGNLRTGMANLGIISGLSLSALYPLTLYLESIWPV